MLNRYETAYNLLPKWESQKISMTPCGKDNPSSMYGVGELSTMHTTEKGKKESRSRSPVFTEEYCSDQRSRKYSTPKESPLKKV